MQYHRQKIKIAVNNFLNDGYKQFDNSILNHSMDLMHLPKIGFDMISFLFLCKKNSIWNKDLGINSKFNNNASSWVWLIGLIS